VSERTIWSNPSSARPFVADDELVAVERAARAKRRKRSSEGQSRKIWATAR